MKILEDFARIKQNHQKQIAKTDWQNTTPEQLAFYRQGIPKLQIHGDEKTPIFERMSPVGGRILLNEAQCSYGFETKYQTRDGEVTILCAYPGYDASTWTRGWELIEKAVFSINGEEKTKEYVRDFIFLSAAEKFDLKTLVDYLFLSNYEQIWENWLNFHVIGKIKNEIYKQLNTLITSVHFEWRFSEKTESRDLLNWQFDFEKQKHEINVHINWLEEDWELLDQRKLALTLGEEIEKSINKTGHTLKRKTNQLGDPIDRNFVVSMGPLVQMMFEKYVLSKEYRLKKTFNLEKQSLIGYWGKNEIPWVW